MSKSFLKSNILVLIIANSANLFAYLYQFIMGRYLSVESFGILTSVNSFGIMFSAFFGVIPYVVSKYIIEFKYDNDLVSIFLKKVLSFTIYTMIFLSFLSIAFIDKIASYLNLKDHIPIYIFIAYLFAGVILSVFFGAMQGLLMYVKVSIKGALVSFLKLFFGVIIVVWLGYSYNGALFASFLANTIVGIWVYLIVIKYIPLKKINDKELPKATYKKASIYALPVGLTWLIVGLMTNIDIVLVKHYVTDFEAGEYAVASVISKIAVFLPGVLLSVLFPQVSQNNVDGKSSKSTLIIVMGLTLLLSFSFVGFVWLFPESIITVLFGKKYIGAANVLVLITLAMAFVAVISVLFNFLLAKHIYGYLYITSIIICIFTYIIFEYMHGSSMEIILAILYACLTILILNILYLFYFQLRGRI